MTVLVRLSSPIQSWAGFRLSYRETPTAPVPSKSGVAGLLGACLGVTDYRSLIDQFDLHVRADRTNPIETDLQVASEVKVHEIDGARRAARAAGDSRRTFNPHQKDGGLLAYRDYLPHAEFFCTIDTDDEERLLEAFRDPAFLPYLGRRANAIEFPFLFGSTDLDAEDLFGRLPTTASNDSLRVHHVTGTYEKHQSDVTTINVTTTTREEQLTWAKQNLNR